MRSLAKLFDGRLTESAVRASGFQKRRSCILAAQLFVLNLHEVAIRARLRSCAQTKRRGAREHGRGSYLYLPRPARGCNIWGSSSADLLRGVVLPRSRKAHDNDLAARPFQFAPQKNSSTFAATSKRPLPREGVRNGPCSSL